MTTLVDALEAEGWVERRPHPTDRRATLVVLTDEGATEASRMDARRHEAARALFGDASRADLATFVAVANQVLQRIGAATAAMPTATTPTDVDEDQEAQPRAAGAGRRDRRRTPDRRPPPSRHEEEE